MAAQAPEMVDSSQLAWRVACKVGLIVDARDPILEEMPDGDGYRALSLDRIH
jgi:hypothetical protein